MTNKEVNFSDWCDNSNQCSELCAWNLKCKNYRGRGLVSRKHCMEINFYGTTPAFILLMRGAINEKR